MGGHNGNPLARYLQPGDTGGRWDCLPRKPPCPPQVCPTVGAGIRERRTSPPRRGQDHLAATRRRVPYQTRTTEVHLRQLYHDSWLGWQHKPQREGSWFLYIRWTKYTIRWTLPMEASSTIE